jgi:hypothetical protein
VQVYHETKGVSHKAGQRLTGMASVTAKASLMGFIVARQRRLLQI